MYAAIFVLACASLLAAGILFKHHRLLTFLAAAGTIWQAQWLGLTLIDRAWLHSAFTPAVYLIGSILLLLPWLTQLKQWSWPYRHLPGSGKKDIAVLIVMFIVLIATTLITQQNGFVGITWRSHGFYNGDTMTMMALVNKSMLTDGLVIANPLAANQYLEYPSLWHGGLATLLHALNISNGWAHFLPTITYGQIILTIPLFFLLLDLVWPEPTQVGKKWLGVSSKLAIIAWQAGLVFFVLGIAWDNYVYPQSHFFLTNLFLLLLSLLLVATDGKHLSPRWFLLPAGLVTLVLLLTNAVTGSVAVTVTVVFYSTRLINARGHKVNQLVCAAAIIFFVVTYLLWSPGDAMLGWPHFSYTAAESIMRFSLVALGLITVLLLTDTNLPFLAISVTLLLLMSFFIFFFSQRDIVVANAERFIYHGLLVGFPLLLPLLLRAYYWLVNKISFHANSFVDKSIIYAAIAITLLFVWLPVLSSGARTHDSLMRQDEQTVTYDLRAALDWINDRTSPTAVFLADPNSPWAIPMFTGRSLLRANYWLSPDDDTRALVNQAFAGDKAAQMAALQQVDYLLLRHNDLRKWNINEQEAIYHGIKLSIFPGTKPNSSTRR